MIELTLRNLETVYVNPEHLHSMTLKRTDSVLFPVVTCIVMTTGNRLGLWCYDVLETPDEVKAKMGIRP